MMRAKCGPLGVFYMVSYRRGCFYRWGDRIGSGSMFCCGVDCLSVGGHGRMFFSVNNVGSDSNQYLSVYLFFSLLLWLVRVLLVCTNDKKGTQKWFQGCVNSYRTSVGEYRDFLFIYLLFK